VDIFVLGGQEQTATLAEKMKMFMKTNAFSSFANSYNLRQNANFVAKIGTNIYKIKTLTSVSASMYLST
jgi:hypothetical protein